MTPSFIYNKLIIKLLILLPWITLAQAPVPVCGTEDSLTASYLEKISRKIDLTTARANAGEMLEYHLAIDVDYRTAAMYGHDEARIRNVVYNIFAETSGIFEREMNIKLTVNYIHIWRQPEPYLLNDDYAYYNNIADYWNRERREERDAVVSLSARYGTFLGGYRMCTSNFPQPDERFVVDILAHELGHTLGSPHTHNCSWPGGPIDRCSAIENPTSTCPSGRLEMQNGTIMSYCRAKLTFHPLCRTLIRQYAEGAIQPSFSLKRYTEKPDRPGLITQYGQGSSTPSFEWHPSQRTKHYRLQIASDEAFTRVMEDTTLNQAFFQSPGISEGNYFVRYQPENDLGNAGWSMPVGFKVGAFTASVAPPPLVGIVRNNAGTVSGSFRGLEGVTDYQVRVGNTDQSHYKETTGRVTGTGWQHFEVSHGMGDGGRIAVQYRIGRQDVWSQWSGAVWFDLPAGTQHISLDSTRKLSVKPTLITRQWVPEITPGAFAGEMQIATDPSFRDIVFEQPFINNAPGDWLTDKEIFLPTLGEGTTYFMRSRVSTPHASAWTVSKFSTGVEDLRFQFIGIPSRVLQSGNYRYTFSRYTRFVKGGDNLYVFNLSGGFQHTTDLKTWKDFQPSFTNGQSPQRVTAFGASPDGQILIADPSEGFVLKKGDAFESISTAGMASWNDVETMLYAEGMGFFLRSFDKGIVQYQNGAFTFHRNAIELGIPQCLGKDNRERIWTVASGGAVWRFENDQWSKQAAFPWWSEGIYGMVFDRDDNCYIYGDFGLSRYDAASARWVLIEPFRKMPLRKIVFDTSNTMWIASYRVNYETMDLDHYALIKWADGKTTIYSDGLNFPREPFDIEYYKDQLLIMTTGGEIHAFDERRILAFEPESNYPAGAGITVKLGSNSTFGADNRFAIQLNNQLTGAKTRIDEVTVTGSSLHFTLPDTLRSATYTVQLIASSPNIISHESRAFRVEAAGSPVYERPNEVVLLQNAPNPAAGPTSIAFYLPQGAEARVDLFNLRGQFIRQLGNAAFPAGWNFIQTDMTGYQSGMYVYRLTTGNVVKSAKMIN